MLVFCESCDTVFCSTCTSNHCSPGIIPGSEHQEGPSLQNVITDHTVVPFSIAIKRMSEILLYKANEISAKVSFLTPFAGLRCTHIENVLFNVYFPSGFSWYTQRIMLLVNSTDWNRVKRKPFVMWKTPTRPWKYVSSGQKRMHFKLFVTWPTGRVKCF